MDFCGFSVTFQNKISLEVVYMSKNPKNVSKPVKRSEPMNGAMKFFLTGCVAELYLLIVQKYYIRGSDVQQIAWYDHYLWYLMGAGIAVLAVGVILSVLWKANQKKRQLGWCTIGFGAFMAAASFLIRSMNTTAMTFLCVLVPVVMLLGIFWTLYDRECALSLTVLGSGLMALWVCNKALSNIFYGTYVKLAAVLFLVLLAVLAALIKTKKLSRLLPASADPKPVYVACVLSAIGLVIGFFSTTLGYYAMWALAVVVFALAVYYTVKQL